MTEQEIWNKLIDTIQQHFGTDAVICRDTTAKDIVGWDSMEHLLLLDEIEETFSVHFSLVDLRSFQNVGKIADCLVGKLS